MQPVAKPREPETHYPLDLLYCHNCTLAQLSVQVPPDELFPADYPYSSGNSQALHDNFRSLAREAESYAGGLGRDDLVVDIGANDGTLLSKFNGGVKKIAVEPTAQVRKVNTYPSNIADVYQAFFTENIARILAATRGQAKVITACNVLAHVQDVHDVMRGIDTLLAPDGILVVENHDLASIVDGGQWDTVYHEHLRYFSPYSFDKLLAQFGMKAAASHRIPTHGGSFRIVAERVEPGFDLLLPRREFDFDHLVNDAYKVRNHLRRYVNEIYEYDDVVGVGATARATTIINYCGLDVEDIRCVYEVPGSEKIGRFIPGTCIPVVSEDDLVSNDPRAVVLFSWHLKDLIVPKLRERGFDGEIIVPLPTLVTA